MSKFNGTVKKEHKRTNYTGHVNFVPKDEFKYEVSNLVLNSMLTGDGYYESEETTIKKIKELVSSAKTDEQKEFILKAMVFGRHKGYLRSVSHVFGAESAVNLAGTPKLRKALRLTMFRPDDATEMLSYLNTNYDYIPNSFRTALKDAFETNWDTYQLRKYQGKRKEVKLVDALNISHPSERKWQENFNSDERPFHLLVTDNLPAIQTAQTINSATKEGSVERHIAYMEEIRRGKLGRMAFLKNIVKIVEGANEKDLEDILEFMSNEGPWKKAKLLPFRYLDAFFALKSSAIKPRFKTKLISKLEELFIMSSGETKLIPDEATAKVLIDLSGSMSGEPLKYAVSLAAMLIAREPFIEVVGFATSAVNISPKGQTPFAWIDTYFGVYNDYYITTHLSNTVGYGTNVDVALHHTKDADITFVLSDMQMYRFGSKSISYLASMQNEKKNVIAWDLSPYTRGTPFSKNEYKVMQFSGFSDKMVEYMPLILSGQNISNIIDAVNL